MYIIERLNVGVQFPQLLPQIVIRNILTEGLSGASLKTLFFALAAWVPHAGYTCLVSEVRWERWWPLQFYKGGRT